MTSKKTKKISKDGSPFIIDEGLRGYASMVVKAALREDVGEGDITTIAIVAATKRGKAVLIAKERLIVCGHFVAALAFKEIDKAVKYKPLTSDGTLVKKGSVIAELSGPLRGILTAERVALNLMQRMSGIATLTNTFTNKVRSTRAIILDTRKTTPCLRLLERYAVKTGGGSNHRFGLFDAVLIKDNHIAAANGVGEAIKRARKNLPEGTPIEVEAASLKEVRTALASRADIILLDNMKPEVMARAVKLVDGHAVTEASGGVNLDNVGDVAKSGVDFISIGAITHSAGAVDISLEVTS